MDLLPPLAVSEQEPRIAQEPSNWENFLKIAEIYFPENKFPSAEFKAAANNITVTIPFSELNEKEIEKLKNKYDVNIDRKNKTVIYCIANAIGKFQSIQ